MIIVNELCTQILSINPLNLAQCQRSELQVVHQDLRLENNLSHPKMISEIHQQDVYASHVIPYIEKTLAISSY